MGSWREGRASVAEGALARAFQLGLRYSSALEARTRLLKGGDESRAGTPRLLRRLQRSPTAGRHCHAAAASGAAAAATSSSTSHALHLHASGCAQGAVHCKQPTQMNQVMKGTAVLPALKRAWCVPPLLHRLCCRCPRPSAAPKRREAPGPGLQHKQQVLRVHTQ